MNAFWIRSIAIAAMLVDHVALLYFPHSLPLQIIGRLSFPLIAWLIANGAIHTRDIDAYAIRLGIFAVLAQIPVEIYDRALGYTGIFFNVLFTLLFGLLAIRALRLPIAAPLRWIAVVACCAAAYALHCDYGVGGVLSIVAFYLWFGRPVPMLVAQAFIYIIFNRLDFFVSPALPGRLMLHPLQAYGLLALPIIWLYNGARGRAAGYFFYWFFIAQEIAVLALQYSMRR